MALDIIRILLIVAPLLAAPQNMMVNFTIVYYTHLGVFLLTSLNVISYKYQVMAFKHIPLPPSFMAAGDI